MHSGERPISAEHYVLLGLVIGHACHHDLAVGGQVFGRLGHLRSPLSHLLGLLLRTIIHRQLVTGVEQPLGHMTAHVTHADEANAWFQMVAFHTHRNTSLSSEMLRYDPLRHPPANLLSYKDEVRGESGVSRHCPRPLNQRGPAWSASNTHKYTGNIAESQRPSDGMSLLLTSQKQPSHSSCVTPRREASGSEMPSDGQ